MSYITPILFENLFFNAIDNIPEDKTLLTQWFQDELHSLMIDEEDANSILNMFENDSDGQFFFEYPELRKALVNHINKKQETMYE